MVGLEIQSAPTNILQKLFLGQLNIIHFFLRSTNKGISAIINNKGEVIKKLNPNEAGNIELKVPLIKSGNKNKNDLIFFILLFTYILIFYLNKKNNDK